MRVRVRVRVTVTVIVIVIVLIIITIVIYWLPPLPPTHRGIVCVGSGRVVGDCASILPDSELA